ncbi:MAG: helix-turn-helix transcriptional regulator [Tannerella sp.]|uniref:response regulator transcription factor n=1 Tax=uncultured Coprobacter sp. TaxID=1720550 RepID=UPI00260FB805|nr:helix-turn-helix transcriptional regulator [uncultured Coprobacter sp.]MBS6267388.1 helix-turn-helix transcriptional regulator [Tannerella sp.]
MTSGQIINNTNGKAVQQKEYQLYDNLLLSPREKEVLMLLAKGHSSKQIADILNISTNTVYRHRQNILSTLQVSNTAAAIQVGFRLNII